MKAVRFKTTDELIERAAGLVLQHLQPADTLPQAVLLPGGRTPAPVYEKIAASGARAPIQTHLMLSDERMVPTDSAESNYGMIRPMIEALGIVDEHVLKVQTHLRAIEAAAHYDQDLSIFLARGGSITLALLGLGADGHTASLFSMEDIERSGQRLAIDVARPNGPDRVTVTPALLARAERIVFLISGEEKRDVVRQLLDDPLATPAGRASADARNVEAWFDF